MIIATDKEKYESDILLLCEKVREVLDNNDWPTEEGQDRSDESPCLIRQIVNRLEEGIS